jgi:uncharacterized protein (TIGR00251 family)
VIGVTVEERRGAVRFWVRVQPRASKNEVCGAFNGALKVRLQAPPVDGAANDALVALLAESFGVARRQVRVLTGATSRSKVVEIDGIERARVHRLVEGLEEGST